MLNNWIEVWICRYICLKKSDVNFFLFIFLQNRTVYDIPSRLINKEYLHRESWNSSYHQEKLLQLDNKQFNNRIHRTSRSRTVNNKFYGHPPIINDKHQRNENNEEEENESTMYSTTTDIIDSFLVPSSGQRMTLTPPAPKPRYSTLSSTRLSLEKFVKTPPVPLPKARSRSNSRTHFNNPNIDNPSSLYNEHPISSIDTSITYFFFFLFNINILNILDLVKNFENHHITSSIV